MTSSKYIGSMDFDGMHFAPIVTEKGRKSVNIYKTTNCTYDNRMQFQLNKDEDSPTVAKWNLDEPQEDPVRRSMEVFVYDKQSIAKLEELNNKVHSKACERTREWWKKELSPEAISMKQKSLIHSTGEDGTCTVKFKVVVPHPNPEPGKKYPKPTIIYKLLGNDKIVKSDASILTKDAEITPSLSFVGVWFMGDSSFGVSLKADVLFVKPKVEPRPIERLSLQRKYVEVEEDADSKMADGAPEASEAAPEASEDAPEASEAAAEDASEGVGPM